MKRVLRGLKAMHQVFGLQFTAAIVGVAALLLWAIYHQHGGLAFVAALICLLLAIRAHDLGEEVEEPEPTEYERFWGGTQWTEEQKARFRQQHAERVRFEQERDAVALGKPHAPAEL